MAEKHAEPRANPIFLGILFAAILATLVFILMTGDYGEPTVPEELVMVQLPAESAPAPLETEVPAVPIAAPVATEVQPKTPPAPVVTEETGDRYARESIDASMVARRSPSLLLGDYVVERVVAIIDALRRGEVPYKLLPVGKPSTTFQFRMTDFGSPSMLPALAATTVLPSGSVGSTPRHLSPS
jgi:hypothetical protein